MENKTIINTFSNNGHSLQLRSKEASEVMGKIPGWIGSWGALLICLLFTVSMLFIANIDAVRKISGKALTGWQETDLFNPQKTNYFLQVVITASKSNDISEEQRVTLFSEEKNNYLSNLNGSVFSVIKKMKINKDSCVLILSLMDDGKEKTNLFKEGFTSAGVECRLETTVAIYKKMFGSLF